MTLRTNNLVTERRNPNGQHRGTVVWPNTGNTIGLKVDMSQGDLLSTLHNIEAISDPSLQPVYLNCPNGFQLERLEERSPRIQGKSRRPCLICSEDQYLHSSCVNSKNYTSAFLSSLTVNASNCPRNFHLTQDGCQLIVKDLIKEQEYNVMTYMLLGTILNWESKCH